MMLLLLPLHGGHVQVTMLLSVAATRAAQRVVAVWRFSADLLFSLFSLSRSKQGKPAQQDVC
jgi:hypothetical protein